MCVRGCVHVYVLYDDNIQQVASYTILYNIAIAIASYILSLPYYTAQICSYSYIIARVRWKNLSN